MVILAKVTDKINFFITFIFYILIRMLKKTDNNKHF